jgi:hypothetical protein
MPLPQNKGLLAFIYDIYTKSEKAAAFQSNPWGVMDQYELNVDQKRAVWSVGLDRANAANDEAWVALGAGGVPLVPGSGKPHLEDARWPNDGAMALLGSMLVDVLSGDPQWEDSW